MSQDPYGYQPQPVGYSPQYSFMPYYSATPQQLLAPARLASWMMIVLGALLIVIGMCFGTVLFSLSDAEYQKVINDLLVQQPELRQFDLTPQLFRIVYGTFLGIAGVYGLALLVMGILTRSGKMLWVVFSLIACVVPLLGIALMILLSLTSGVQGLISSVCVCGLPAALLLGAMVFLVRALVNAPKIAAAEQQTAALYQQQMQQYYASQPPESSGQ